MSQETSVAASCSSRITHHASLITHHVSLKLLAQPLIHNFRICFALRSLHHLADKESEQSFLARAILFELTRVRRDHFVDDAIDFASVTDLYQTTLFDDCGSG